MNDFQPHWPLCVVCGIRHDPQGAHQRFQPEAIPFPKRKRTLRVVTKTNHAFDFNLPDDFSMAILTTHVKASGHFVNESFYVPHDQISVMFVWEEGTPPKGDQSNVVVFPGTMS